MPGEFRVVTDKVLTHGEIAAVRFLGLPASPSEPPGAFWTKPEAGNGLTDNSKGPIRLALPAKAVPYYFPDLYPEGVEAAILEKSE